jgi:WD40 repeat protein
MNVKLWNPTNTAWNLLKTYNTGTSVNALEYINATTMASGGQDKKVQIWSMSTATLIKSISPGGPVNSLQMLKNGFHIVIGAGPFIFVYNINDGTKIATLNGHIDAVTDFVLMRSGNLLASASRDKTIRIWDITTLTPTKTSTRTLTGHTNQVYGLKLVSYDMLASASVDQTVRLWSISSGTLLNTLNHTNTLLYSVDFLNCQTFVSGCVSNTEGFKVWSTLTGDLLNVTLNNMQIKSLAVIYPTTSNF